MKATIPANLGTKARKMWRDITGTYDLRADELRILEDACREIDLIERFEARMVDASLTVRGSMGQTVAHPLIQELRQHRMALKTLLGALSLPDGEPDEDNASTRARKAAAARWGRGA